MGEKKQPVYDESKIKTLSSLEHIRLRSGMYIGRLGSGKDPDDGIYVLLKEVVDNSVDEFIMGHGRRIIVGRDGKRIKVRDFGRGIPLGKLVECVSVINTGAKYNDDVFQFSVGLNGVGTKAVNALSSHFRAVAVRGGKAAEAVFSKGKLLKERQIKSTTEADGTFIEFEPDEEIFGEYDFNDEFIEKRIKNYTYLNAGLELDYNGTKYVSKNGLLDLLQEDLGDKEMYTPLYYRGDKIEFVFTHTLNYGETFYSFVNGQYTSDGGTHESAYKEGLLKGLNEFYKKAYSGVDVREGIVGAVSVKIKDPVFESQTKNKLGNTNIKAWIVQEVKSAVIDFLHKNGETAKKIQAKIINNENLRKELNAVRKEAKELSKKTAIRIPCLNDCKYHKGEDKEKGENTMIFLTEGQSASGSMVKKRDVYKQAIFSLRGKPLNVFGKKKTEIYKNEEIHNIVKALGIENSIDDLRYDKVVLATDADNDGFHIRNLILTIFLTFFEDLVKRGHVYILETPLFRVRNAKNNKETAYCYTEKERDNAAKTVKNPEVTRFKGLGEISPDEFGQFIGEDIRLVKVEIKSSHDINETLEFYMGKNTPERKSYIMENLI